MQRDGFTVSHCGGSPPEGQTHEEVVVVRVVIVVIVAVVVVVVVVSVVVVVVGMVDSHKIFQTISSIKVSSEML